MGRYGYYVIDADGHGGEPIGWRKRVPDRFRDRMVEYVRATKEHYGRAAAAVPGGGMQISGRNPRTPVWAEDEFEVTPPTGMRPGMYDAAPRLDDMDLEGIDVAVLFPPGAGEEFALNDARAEFAAHAPDRLKLVAKLPMIDPEAAAEELERCVRTNGFVGLVCAQHIL